MRIKQAFQYLLSPLNRKGNYLLAALFFCSSPVLVSQSVFLDSLLKAGLLRYEDVLDNPDKYRLQVFYTQINRDVDNTPRFVTHALRNSKQYVYPASTVKLPLSLLSLMKLEELHIKGLEKNSPMMTDSAFHCRKRIETDSSSGTVYPTLENYIKKMLLVSDNQAFARAFDFVTYDYAHDKLALLGFEKIRLFNRLEIQCQWDTIRATAPVYFLSAKGDTVYKQGSSFLSGKPEHPVRNSTAGLFHQNAKGKWVKGPKDFSLHNYLEPKDLHQLMEMLVFNNYNTRHKNMELSDDSRKFLLKQLGSYPRESERPAYNPKPFYDSYKKYLLYGAAVAQIKQDSIRVINIVGRAYGFLIDCAYIIDFKNNLEFLVTCAVYVNKNGRIGSGKYEYDQLGLPFMRDLGWCIYNYERNRKKKHLPDLSEFNLLFNTKP